MGVLEATSTADVVFARTGSVANVIERLVRATKSSIDAALYRFNSQRLAKALEEVHERGINIRLIIDRNKYEESVATRQLLSGCPFPFRLTYGRAGAGSKMHHKFVVLDQAVVLTGSYNWTFASEEQNYENLLILRERSLTETHHREFEALWAGAEDVRRSRSWGLESKEPAKSLNDEGALPL